MSDATLPRNRQPDSAVTEQTHRALEEAEKGNTGGVSPSPKPDEPNQKEDMRAPSGVGTDAKAVF
jgi:hypothetical protein